MILESNLSAVITPEVDFNFKYPLGDLSTLPVLESVFFKRSYPNGVLNILNTYSSTFTYSYPESILRKNITPIASIIEVFFAPVLAIDNGFSFLVLDDGGRLIIDY